MDYWQKRQYRQKNRVASSDQAPQILRRSMKRMKRGEYLKIYRPGGRVEVFVKEVVALATDLR
jgi:hypothetical protein